MEHWNKLGEFFLITHDEGNVRESQVESECVEFPEACLLVLDDVASVHVPGVGDIVPGGLIAPDEGEEVFVAAVVGLAEIPGAVGESVSRAPAPAAGRFLEIWRT